MNKKTCTKCKREQPYSDFTKFARERDGLHYTCKSCTQSTNRTYRERNREKLNAKKKADYRADRAGHLAKTRAWTEANPERHQYLQRRSHLKTMYGLTPEQYDWMLQSQGYVCAICKEPSAKRLHVDHDHGCCPGKRSCGRCLRGLLCGPCNRLLGWFETKRTPFEEYMSKGQISWPS